MKKRLISLFLLFTLILSICVYAQAAEAGNYVSEAEQLRQLGVFQGTGAGFELGREPTRLEGLVMLIRLLGREAEAKALAEEACAFTDVPAWGAGYVNYAYENGLTKGVGNHLFGSADKLNAPSYTTFLLRTLGYSDGGGDFAYDGSIEFAEQIGLYSEADAAELRDGAFLRGQLAKVSVLALGTNMKGGGATLLDKLARDGVISEEAASAIDTEASRSLRVHFLDVGQADSILITKGDEAMLLDGGNAPDAGKIIDYIKSHGVSALKYVLATHPHEDHIGALAAVIQSFQVENVIMPEVAATTRVFEDLLTAVGEKGLEITKPAHGDSYGLNGASFTILAPVYSSYQDMNDHSIVIKLVNGRNSFLFTGDAEEQSEADMLSLWGSDLQSDVLKAGHHGSASSTSRAFLDAVNPAYAVISVGAGNPFGHPDPSVLERLAARGIQVFRTDTHGDIVAVSNGNTIVFRTGPAPASGSGGDTGGEMPSIAISAVDKRAELVTITNTGAAEVDLTGWVLLSVTGNQSYTFPSVVLRPGQSLTVASGGAVGDLIWTAEHVWNNTSSDPAHLYDADGSLISRYAA